MQTLAEYVQGVVNDLNDEITELIDKLADRDKEITYLKEENVQLNKLFGRGE